MRVDATRGRSAVRDLEVLPEFPDLAPVAPEHLGVLRRFTGRFGRYSDFDATSLWAWSSSVSGGFRVARWGADLVVEFGDYLGGDRFLSFLGTDRVDDAAAALLEDAAARGLATELRLVPEVTADRLDRRRWLQLEQPDEHDYVYDLVRHATMPGPEYRNLRRRYHRFERRYRDVVELEWLSADALPDLADDLLSVFDSWRGRGSDGSRHADPERSALERLVRTAPVAAPDTSGMSSVCRLDGTVIAFAIVEAHPEGDLGLHFRKVADCPAGYDLESWLSVETARRAVAAGFRSVNEQQDLGIPGLRRAKQDRRPARLLRKFRI